MPGQVTQVTQLQQEKERPVSTATLNASIPRNFGLNNSGSADQDAILDIIENLRQALLDKNVAQFAAQFAPCAAIFNLAPPLTHRGVDREEKQAWFESWSTPIELEPRDFKITIRGDLAVCYGLLRMAGSKRGVPSPVNFWMRETLCLERHPSGWHIVHKHTSVPFYMDRSTRPAFDLQP
jgi:ketosteroid isomerase-like protein